MLRYHGEHRVHFGRLGLLTEAGGTWDTFRSQFSDAQAGTEHLVEFVEGTGAVLKFTIPPNIGLTPYLAAHPVISAAGESQQGALRHAIEFRSATPLEYLERWLDANEVFSDDVQLQRVIRWSDGLVSFVMAQPQYHGEPATERQIDRYFNEAGWKHLSGASGHSLFYNYAYGVLAIDALPRNCRIHEGRFMPFDVILCRPDDALSDFLKLYP